MIYLEEEEKSREQWAGLDSEGTKAQCVIPVLGLAGGLAGGNAG